VNSWSTIVLMLIPVLLGLFSSTAQTLNYTKLSESEAGQELKY